MKKSPSLTERFFLDRFTSLNQEELTVIGIFLDSEANGLNALYHSILEIAFKLILIQTGEVKDTYDSVVYQTPQDWKKSNLNSLKVNGFTYEKVEKGKKKSVVAEEIIHLFQKHQIHRNSAVFICQNPSFDRIFFSQLVDLEIQEKLQWPYHWLDLASMYWATSIQKGRKDSRFYPWVTGFSKDKIAQAYGLPPEKQPHKAMNGVDHLILCYEKIIGFKD